MIPVRLSVVDFISFQLSVSQSYETLTTTQSWVINFMFVISTIGYLSAANIGYNFVNRSDNVCVISRIPSEHPPPPLLLYSNLVRSLKRTHWIRFVNVGCEVASVVFTRSGTFAWNSIDRKMFCTTTMFFILLRLPTAKHCHVTQQMNIIFVLKVVLADNNVSLPPSVSGTMQGQTQR